MQMEFDGYVRIAFGDVYMALPASRIAFLPPCLGEQDVVVFPVGIDVHLDRTDHHIDRPTELRIINHCPLLLRWQPNAFRFSRLLPPVSVHERCRTPTQRQDRSPRRSLRR